MLVSQSIGFVDSDYTTDFQGFLVQNASAYADLSVSGDTHSAGQVKGVIESVRLLTMQNLDWRVEFYSKTLPSATSGINLNNLLGYVNFFSTVTANSTLKAVTLSSAEWSRVATGYATMFVYFAQGLRIPYEDKGPRGGQLHVNLVNLNGTAKLAGDTGAVHIRCGLIAAA